MEAEKSGKQAWLQVFQEFPWIWHFISEVKFCHVLPNIQNGEELIKKRITDLHLRRDQNVWLYYRDQGLGKEWLIKLDPTWATTWGEFLPEIVRQQDRGISTNEILYVVVVCENGAITIFRRPKKVSFVDLIRVYFRQK